MSGAFQPRDRDVRPGGWKAALTGRLESLPYVNSYVPLMQVAGEVVAVPKLLVQPRVAPPLSRARAVLNCPRLS